MIITELLAVLSISAATGFRLALPLLMIGMMSDNLWSQVPILSQFPPALVVGTLVSWTLAELIFSKEPPTQRVFQSVELFFSPLAGTIAGITIARTFNIGGALSPLLGILGGLLALVIHLVQVGWLYRLKSPSIWLIAAEDILCACLVFFAFDAPHQGGLIALLLLWLALRTSNVWRNWYVSQASARHRHQPRHLKRDPD